MRGTHKGLLSRLSVRGGRAPGSRMTTEMPCPALQGALPAVPMSTQSSPQKEVSLNTARDGKQTSVSGALCSALQCHDAAAPTEGFALRPCSVHAHMNAARLGRA